MCNPDKPYILYHCVNCGYSAKFCRCDGKAMPDKIKCFNCKKNYFYNTLSDTYKKLNKDLSHNRRAE